MLSPVSRGPGLSWDSRHALHRSPPNEFGCHDPSGRRLLGHSLTMESNFRQFKANLSSSTFPRVVIALDVFDDSAVKSSRKDHEYFAGLCSSVESFSEMPPLVCALRGVDTLPWHHRYFGDRRLPRQATLPPLSESWFDTQVLGTWWTRDDPGGQYRNARALSPCIRVGLDKWSPARNGTPWQSLSAYPHK